VSLLISVHLPKTAGASLRLALDEHFGDRLLRDYEDRPLSASAALRNTLALSQCLKNCWGRSDLRKFACIHGHFMPLKYRLLRMPDKKQFVTWMRDPVERLASHYAFWLRTDQQNSFGELHRRVIEERWSLERFCLGPELRNTYSKFLWGFPLNRFDFIGITEFYDTDMEYFSEKFMGVNLPVIRENVNPEREKALYGEPCDCVRTDCLSSLLMRPQAELSQTGTICFRQAVQQFLFRPLHGFRSLVDDCSNLVGLR
jgi:hypothetical protein